MSITLNITPSEESGLELFRLAHNANPENADNQLATVADYTYYRFQEILSKELIVAERKRFDALYDDPVKRTAAISAGESV